MSAKELKDKLKALRSEFGRPITKMTAEEMEKEIAHHETAKKAAEIKSKRLEALAKAREARKPVKIETKPAKKTESAPAPKPRAKKTKKVEEYSDASSTDHDSEDSEKHETIKSRIQKK
jgi:sRNA-binding protein